MQLPATSRQNNTVLVAPCGYMDSVLLTSQQADDLCDHFATASPDQPNWFLLNPDHTKFNEKKKPCSRIYQAFGKPCFDGLVCNWYKVFVNAMDHPLEQFTDLINNPLEPFTAGGLGRPSPCRPTW
jgi:hypothetical protein